MNSPQDRFEKMAMELWRKIYPRIKFMGDYENGTHALYCVEDIAHTLSTLSQEYESEALLSERQAAEKAVLKEREGCIQAVLGLDGDVFVIERAVEAIRQRRKGK